jgi:hypothetical protein
LEGAGLEKMILTTSFLEIVAEAKDTRLLPRGWKPDGPYNEYTGLFLLNLAKKMPEPWLPEKPDQRIIRYEIPESAGKVARVRISMHYQAIPPYYLQDRLEYDTPETRRLYYMVAHLETEGTPLENWSFKLVEREFAVQ